MRLYRIVKSNPHTRADFLSNAAKGRQPRNPTPEVLRRWDGLSAFTSFEAALANARIFPRLGRFIVELDIPMDGSIAVEPHPGPDEEHVTIWGDPDLLTEMVTNIVRIG